MRLFKRLKRTLMVVLLLTAGMFMGDSAWIMSKAVLAQHFIQTAWQKTLDGELEVKPWSWADTWPVARLQSSKHHVDVYVLDGVQGQALAFGPGYMKNSAAPNHAGTTVIAGHRDTHFSFMKQLAANDTLTLTSTDGVAQRYRVETLDVIDSDKESLSFNAGGSKDKKLLLVTCYPFDAVTAGGPLRYVATAVAI